MLEHKCGSESLQELSNPRPSPRNTSLDTQSLLPSCALPSGLFLSSSRPAASFHALNMAVTLSRSLARLNTLAFTAISFHGLPFCVFSADGMKRDLKGQDVRDPVFMWGLRANVRTTASNIRTLECEVADLLKSC